MSEEKKGFFKRLVSGLTKTRDNIVAGFDSIFSGYSSIDEDFYEELEECGKRLMGYKDCFEIMGKDRNSYSKKDLEATFMRMKEDSYA